MTTVAFLLSHWLEGRALAEGGATVLDETIHRAEETQTLIRVDPP